MKFRLSSEYGALEEVRQGRVHNGIDLALPEGTELRSLFDGEVVEIFDGTTNIGKGVKIELEDGTELIYGHMSEVSVKVGDKIEALQEIGLSGSTGLSTGAHLHFAIKSPDGEWMNPTPLAPQLSEISGDIDISELDTDSPHWWDIQGQIDAKLEEAKEDMKEEFKEMIYDFLGAVRDVVLEVLDSVVLLGGGTLIILKCWGLRNGDKYLYIAFAARIILKALLGGYIG